MGKWFTYGLTAAVCACFLVAAPLQSASAADPIKIRRAVMKELSGHAKVFKKFFKGGKTKKAIARAGTAGDMVFRAMAIASLADRVPSLFPKGSDKGKTRAKAEIWLKMGEFKGKAANLKSAAMAVQKAAEGGEMAAIKAAYAKMGKACGGCHKQFRAKKKKKSS